MNIDIGQWRGEVLHYSIEAGTTNLNTAECSAANAALIDSDPSGRRAFIEADASPIARTLGV